MSALSDYLENKIAGHVFGGAAYTAPELHVALFTVATNDAGSGGTEVSGNDYARVEVTAGTDITVTGAVATNANAITFPTANGGDWGTVVSIGIYDAATVGNLLVHGNLTASKLVEDGDTFEIAASDLTITFA